MLGLADPLRSEAHTLVDMGAEMAELLDKLL